MQKETRKETQEERSYGIKISPKFILGISIFFLVLLIGIGILTRVLPQGVYDRQLVDGNETIVNGTYHLIDNPTILPVWRWFTAPIEVIFTDNGIMILAVMLISVLLGGVYYVLDKTDTLKRFIGFTYRKLHQHKYGILLLMTTVFLLLGSFLGIADEVVGFTPLMILLAISLGWDSFVGVALCFLATTRGYAASTLNPYGVAFAQSIAGVPLYSGLSFRFLYLAVTGIIFVLFVYFYAKRIDRDPTSSPTYLTDEKWRTQYTGQALFESKKQKYSVKEFFRDFGRGSLDMLPTVIIACLILGIQYLVEEGNLLDTIIYRMAMVTEGASMFQAAMILCAFVLIVEIVLPGTMVKALTVLPIIVPLGEFSGISRQATCLIFAIGDSFPNMIYPTDSMLVLTLAMVGCGYKAWIKWLWPYVLASAAASVGIIALALSVGYGA